MIIYEEYKWTYVKFGENEVPNFYGFWNFPIFETQTGWTEEWENVTEKLQDEL